MRLLHAASLGLAAFGLVKAAVVAAMGAFLGVSFAAVLPVALAWACGPLAAGWAIQRWRAGRMRKKASPIVGAPTPGGRGKA